MSACGRSRPLVACICLTADRPEMTLEAVACYHAQTYPSPLRRLLIFDTSRERPERRIGDWIGDETGCSEVTVFHWYESRWPADTIGSLRNRANSIADTLWHPDLLAHFDSDDLSASGRLEDQVARLESAQGHGKSVTGYRSIIFTNGVKRWRYLGDPAFICGTSLMYRTDWWREHRFPSINICEDSEFASEAWRAGRSIPADGGEMITARIHAGNTSRKEIASNWEELPA